MCVCVCDCEAWELLQRKNSEIVIIFAMVDNLSDKRGESFTLKDFRRFTFSLPHGANAS